MKALSRGLLAAVACVPSLALAGAGSVLDVSLGGGVVGTWTGTTLKVATSFVPFHGRRTLSIRPRGPRQS